MVTGVVVGRRETARFCYVARAGWSRFTVLNCHAVGMIVMVGGYFVFLDFLGSVTVSHAGTLSMSLKRGYAMELSVA